MDNHLTTSTTLDNDLAWAGPNDDLSWPGLDDYLPWTGRYDDLPCSRSNKQSPFSVNFYLAA